MDNTEKTIPTWKQYNRPWIVRLALTVWNYIKNVGLMLWSVIRAIPFKIRDWVFAIGRGVRDYFLRLVKGDWRTWISYLIMGFGCFTRGAGQIVKGLLLLAVEALFIVYMIFIGAPNLGKFGSLGTATQKPNPDGFGYIDGDNSLKILLFSVMTIMLIIFFFIVYVKSTKIAYETQKRAQSGKPLSTFKQQLNYALNDGYHVTILALPLFGILLITVLPLICNILVAFTNFGIMDGDKHYPPAQLFGWIGFDAFKYVFSNGSAYGSAIWRVLGWTLVWAVFATFTNFFFGMFLAMMINKKSIKLKVFWRTCFVIVIAVPDFITLLMMANFFSYSSNTALTGAFNKILQQWFGLKDVNIDWAGGVTNSVWRARMFVIVINMWRGMPYTMLATSGILMNIPDELYESSRIDGAGPVRRFISITFPYIMFVMGPQLITTFTGNINNFNVIFFLTGGGPKLMTDIGQPGRTDLLVTWLYTLTVNKGQYPEYNFGAVIGLFTFLVTAFFTLIVFNSSKSVKQEDTFQ